MQGKLSVVLALLAVAAAVSLPAAATPAAATAWTRVSAPANSNIDQIGLARTRDGVLHVAWLRHNGPLDTDLVVTAIGADGAVRGSAPVVTRWKGLTNPALVAMPDGSLRALFSGLRTAVTGDPYTSGTIYSATAPAAGTVWTLVEGDVAAVPSTAYGSDTIGAAVTPSGTVASSWTGTFGTGVHVGLDPAKPNTILQDRCCGYQSALAADPRGQIVAAWYSNATDAQGTFVQTVVPSLGSPTLAPGSVTEFNNSPSSLAPDQQVGLVARTGGGVYAAYLSGYPTAKQLVLWRVGGGRPLTLPAPNARLATAAPGPDGRIWVAWAEQRNVKVARTNRAATRFGPVLTVAPPPGTQTLYKTRGEGSLGPLDLFVHSQTGSGGNMLATWHRQVLVQLALTATVTPSSQRPRRAAAVRFSVTDAGDAVPGATIEVAGRRLTTDARGRAIVALPGRTGVVRASATKQAYVPATVQVRVR